MPPGLDRDDARPPTEARRAMRASLLGVALGVVLALASRRRRLDYSR
jgi:hypothetical protein